MAVNTSVHIDEKHRIKESHWLVDIVKTILLYIPLIIWTIITCFPFWYMLVVSTRSAGDIFSFPPPLLLKPNFVEQFIANYNNLISRTYYWRNLFNSVYISAMTTLLGTFLCSLAGYGFAMYRFKGRNILFSLMLFTLMVPQTINIIPYFIMMKTFGWISTARAMYLPAAASAFGIFLMRQYIMTSIQQDLVEAARVDGCSEFGIYWRIVLPLITPIIGSYGIITFLNQWNNYMTALVVLKDPKSYTVPLALGSLVGMQSVDYGAIMVGTVISVFPLLIMFIFMSKMIISKVTEGALKE
ncbi:MAG: carbohydrate ABC transporter permease [Brevinematales bacterium]|nr:carbohydrate ABC transporter permease [Brevinematales bacterium]